MHPNPKAEPPGLRTRYEVVSGTSDRRAVHEMRAAGVAVSVGLGLAVRVRVRVREQPVLWWATSVRARVS